VDRVRPAAWDAFVEGNSFLAGIRRIEEGDPATEFVFEAEDLRSLQAAGLGPVVLNAEQFPLVRKQGVRRLHRLFMDLFGQPRARMTRAWAWDAAAWTGATHAPVLALAPGEGSVDGPPGLRAPASEIFTPPRAAFDAPWPEDGTLAERQ